MVTPPQFQTHKQKYFTIFFQISKHQSFFSFIITAHCLSPYTSISLKANKILTLKFQFLLNVKCQSDNIIFKQTVKTMFPYNSQPSMILPNPTPNYYLIDPLLYYSLNSTFEQMKVREESLIKQVNELKEECQDLKLGLNQNLQQLVKECLSQQLNSQPKSQHFTLCVKSYKCKMQGCRKRYSSKTALKAHLKSKHDSSDYYD